MLESCCRRHFRRFVKVAKEEQRQKVIEAMCAEPGALNTTSMRIAIKTVKTHGHGGGTLDLSRLGCRRDQVSQDGTWARQLFCAAQL